MNTTEKILIAIIVVATIISIASLGACVDLVGKNQKISDKLNSEIQANNAEWEIQKAANTINENKWKTQQEYNRVNYEMWDSQVKINEAIYDILVLIS
jgi:uncharacterized membrane protein YraQ (UPF0718 family)